MWYNVDQYSENAFKTVSPTKIGMLGFKMNIDCELMVYFEDMCPNFMFKRLPWPCKKKALPPQNIVKTM